MAVEVPGSLVLGSVAPQSILLGQLLRRSAAGRIQAVGAGVYDVRVTGLTNTVGAIMAVEDKTRELLIFSTRLSSSHLVSPRSDSGTNVGFNFQFETGSLVLPIEIFKTLVTREWVLTTTSIAATANAITAIELIRVR